MSVLPTPDDPDDPADLDAVLARYRDSPEGQAEARRLVADLAERAIRSEARADDVAREAVDRYHRDPLVHARAHLAAQVAQRGPVGRTVANLEREGYARGAADLRAGLAISAATALVMAEGEATAVDSDTGLKPRDRAELLLAGTLAGHGAPDPVALTRRLLEVLADDGLSIVRLA